MALQIGQMRAENQRNWDAYVKSHPMGNIYQLSGWKTVIEGTYNHHAYYLLAAYPLDDEASAAMRLSAAAATDDDGRGAKGRRPHPANTDAGSIGGSYRNSPQIAGVLPLVHLKSIVFGNSLISMPFCDMGGVLADTDQIKRALILEAIKIGERLGVGRIELRSPKNQTILFGENGKQDPRTDSHLSRCWAALTTSDKVRMVLKLPESTEALSKSFKSKLRSQIKKPMKEGLTSRIGQTELLDDFYRVFVENMKDLGSPVHSKGLFRNILKEFPAHSRIIMVYAGKIPTAGGVVLQYKDTVMNPWASSLKSYKRLSPNMLLYWAMLAHACDHGYRFFDFGRCTPNEGTYKFKEQWGAEPEPLISSFFSPDVDFAKKPIAENKILKLGSEVWKKLPLFSTRIVGPIIRKNIDL